MDDRAAVRTGHDRRSRRQEIRDGGLDAGMQTDQKSSRANYRPASPQLLSCDPVWIVMVELDRCGLARNFHQVPDRVHRSMNSIAGFVAEDGRPSQTDILVDTLCLILAQLAFSSAKLLGDFLKGRSECCVSVFELRLPAHCPQRTDLDGDRALVQGPLSVEVHRAGVEVTKVFVHSLENACPRILGEHIAQIDIRTLNKNGSTCIFKHHILLLEPIRSGNLTR